MQQLAVIKTARQFYQKYTNSQYLIGMPHGAKITSTLTSKFWRTSHHTASWTWPQN